MSTEKRNAVIVMLANDAMEASAERGAHAAILLIDAALSVMVTCHQSEDARREMGSMLAEYVTRTVEAVIAGEVSQ